jgi:hypothetical protein
MKKDRRISQIIDICAAGIFSGQETIDSILEKYPQFADELRPRLEALLWLTDAKKDLEPRQGFILATRACLEIQLEAFQPQGFWKNLFKRYTPQRWAFNLTAPVLIIVMLALIINNLVLTARLSLPSEPLFTTKLVLEDIQLAFTFNQADKTDLYIQFSRERTSELVELVLEGDYEVLPAAANRMETEMIASLRSIQALSSQDFESVQPMTAEMKENLTNGVFMLNILKGISPPAASPGIEMAISFAQSGLMALH